MVAFIEEHRGPLLQFWHRCRVQRLEGFGAAGADEAFDPQTSEFDLLVELPPLRGGVDQRAVNRQKSFPGLQGFSPVPVRRIWALDLPSRACLDVGELPEMCIQRRCFANGHDVSGHTITGAPFGICRSGWQDRRDRRDPSCPALPSSPRPIVRESELPDPSGQAAP